MGPPPNSPLPLEIDLQCNNTQIVLFLDNYSEQSILPRNVMMDLNPYEHPPSNLPEGLWYLVRSGVDKEWIHGLWKIKEMPSEIYSNDVITGWKMILEYFPGQAPNEERSDWVMEEFSITRKDFRDGDKMKDVRVLCRVFHGSEIETKNMHNSEPENRLDELDLLAANIPDFDFPFVPDALNENMANLEAELRGIVERDDNKNSPELSSMSGGDYIEMDDLIGPISPGSMSSSSQNSSCTTLTDQYFDEGEIEEDKKKKQLNSECVVTAPDKVDDTPPELEVKSDANPTELLKGPQNGTTDIKSSVGKSVAAPEPEPKPKPKAAKRGISNCKTEDTATTSSGGENVASTSRNKKTSLSKVRKLKPYFCFFF